MIVAEIFSARAGQASVKNGFFFPVQGDDVNDGLVTFTDSAKAAQLNFLPVGQSHRERDELEKGGSELHAAMQKEKCEYTSRGYVKPTSGDEACLYALCCCCFCLLFVFSIGKIVSKRKGSVKRPPMFVGMVLPPLDPAHAMINITLSFDARLRLLGLTIVQIVHWALFDTIKDVNTIMRTKLCMLE